MELHEVFSLGFGLLTGCLGFFVRRLIQELDALKRAFEDLRRDNAKESVRIRDTYVKYEDFVRLQTGIDAKLSQIYELLAGGSR